jgi:LPXTG-motif cell wall-anchored protein
LQQHKIGGGGYMIAQEATGIEVSCSKCHSEAPHEGDEAEALNSHTARVACQTCHIPLLARDPDLPTQMTRDYAQPVLNEARGLYGPKIEKEGNLIPTYLWWNYPLMETPPKPVGSIDDAGAKITPWKPMEVTVPFDAATHTPVHIKQGVYQIKGDLDASVNAGVEASGQEYSGAWEPVTELMYFDSQHQVAPAGEALYCNDCHVPDGRLDFVALGYSPERVTVLTGMAEAAEAEAEAEPAQLPATGAVSLLPWVLVGSGGLLALGGGLLWRRRR